MSKPLAFRCVLVALIGLFVPSALHAQATGPAQTLLDQGQAHYEQFENREALDAFRQAYEQDPDDFEVLKWLVRTQIDYAQDLQAGGQEAEAERQFSQALAHAETLNQQYPDRPASPFFLAAAYGRLAQFKGGREKVKLGRQVEQYAQEAIAMDADYALPYVALGVFYREVANLSWVQRTFADTFFGGLPEASNEKAASMLEEAIALDPQLTIAHYELALTYEEMDQRQQAIEHIRRAIALPPNTTQDVRNQRQARALLTAWRE